ncbi:MAG: hypothetical protein KAQ85_03110 [Thermodesulfovibrionia bacterium]|nr:hypothetical protein [Thermodesulfovibrionia bacterium]
MSWLNSKSYEGEVIYSAFVSDIEAYMVGTRKYPRCPKCREYLTKFIFQYPRKVGEEPNAIYDYKHKCGAKLTLLND